MFQLTQIEKIHCYILLELVYTNILQGRIRPMLCKVVYIEGGDVRRK